MDESVKPKRRLGLHFSLQAFLVVTSMLSGGLCGMTSSAMKLALDIFVFSPNCFTEYMFYVMLAILLLTSFLNFLNLT